MVTKKKEIKKAFAHQSGKRKRAIARATCIAGKGVVRINSKKLEMVEPFIARLRLQEPLLIAGELAKGVDISVNVIGGGWSSQTEAARLAIAKALVDYHKSEDLKKRFLEYDRHLLVADTRRKETKKPITHSHARAKRQKSYR